MNKKLGIAVRLTCRLLAAAFLFGLSGVNSSAQNRAWKFQVLLDDTPIGYHHFMLTDEGEQRKIKSEARFEVRLLFISAYRYQHQATEQWQDNCLERLDAHTSDDGKLSHIKADNDGRQLIVIGGEKRHALDGCAMTFAYWNTAMLRQTRLLNPQTGRVEAVRIVSLPDQQLMVAGKSIAARHYRIEGPDHPVELWYSTDGDWLGLASTVKGGRRLVYRREL